MKFKVKVDSERCKGCGLCVASCPHGVLGMSAELNRKGMHYAAVQRGDACTGCRQCADMCPDTAIAIDRLAADDAGEGLSRPVPVRRDASDSKRKS